MTMSDPAAILQEGWIVLGHGSRASDGNFPMLPTDFFVDGGEILQSLDESGLRHVLIPLSSNVGPRDDSSAGIRITTRSIQSDGYRRTYLDIKCNLPRLNDLFDDLAGDMISAAEGKPADPATACLVVLDRWRSLLRNVRIERPSRTHVVGLIGEMLIAEQVIQRDPGRRIDMWVGREGQRHDFRRGSVSIEVKTTSSSESKAITIHGIDQLNPPEGGSLHLAWQRIEHVPGGDLSITGMIDRLCMLGVPAEFVHMGLDERGLAPGTWPEEEFQLRESAVFEVNGEFPRIVKSMFSYGEVPKGISRLSYEVDLDLAAQSKCADEGAALFDEMAGLP